MKKEYLIKTAVAILALTATYIIQGFVLMKLWSWFIVPVFDVGPIDMLEAIGFMIVIGFIKARRKKPVPKKKFWKEMKTTFSFELASSIFILVIGWMVHLIK